MTVKIAKFFSNSGGPVGNGNDVPPPLPPPNPKNMPATNIYYKQQQQYNPYMLDDEDDNMSLYSTTASIMTTRDHPFNNSQRPLLAERKPAVQMLQKKKQQQQHAADAAIKNHHHYKQQQYEPHYISPYAQAQKRDSAKGLHGFNDFVILSQQYNQHLQQSPHIGYPYGSPPSPTATTNDFVFDNSNHINNELSTNHYKHSAATPRYANTVIDYITANSQQQQHIIDELDYYGTTSSSTSGYMGKSSRFEDDFCCRRNAEFNKHSQMAAGNAAAPSSSASSSSVCSGPFIFGGMPALSHEQQLVCRMPAGGHGFVDCSEPMTMSSDSGVSSVATGDSSKYGKSLMQSTSNTSSSSRDSNSNKNNSNNNNNSNSNSISSYKGAKFLLRKSKTKKKQKQKKSTLADKTINVADDEVAAATKQQTIKCVVVGDGAVGKTNLILSYLENRFIPEHVPTASDIYNADVMVNDNPVHLTLCDTAGQDTLDPLRELCYPDSDVFLLCFSVTKPETFHAIKTKWAPKFVRTKTTLILVGTQADLRTNTNVLNKLQSTGEKPISYADAWDLATTIGAKYIETSSATQDKVKEVFDTAIWEGLRPTTLPPTPPLWKKLLCLA